MIPLAQTVTPQPWSAFLPAVLQQPEAYFTIIVCLAAFGLAKAFPKTDKWPWLAEAASILTGIAVACGLKVGGSYVYSIGTGIICAWGASSFYSLFFAWATAKIRSVIGIPPAPSDPVKMVNTLPQEKP